MGWLLFILGILLLIGGMPLIWKFAKGAARIILSVLIVLLAVWLIWYAVVNLAIFASMAF